jgi:hypothetical protein
VTYKTSKFFQRKNWVIQCPRGNCPPWCYLFIEDERGWLYQTPLVRNTKWDPISKQYKKVIKNYYVKLHVFCNTNNILCIHANCYMSILKSIFLWYSSNWNIPILLWNIVLKWKFRRYALSTGLASSNYIYKT